MFKTNKKLYVIIAIVLIIAGVFFFIKRNAPGLGMGSGKATIPLINFNPPPVPESEIGKHPNILLVIADDMGLDADPCHPNMGSEKPNMPNLEAICKKGIVFDNVWTDPVCSPTRATMMSGQYGFRTGVTDVDKILSPNVESIADVLTNKVPVPYANAFIGKWHMSGPDADLNAPSALGVQYFAGFLGGGVRNYFDYDLDEQGKVTHQNEYITTVFTNKAIGWIQGQKEKDPNRPWFMWLAYNAPHAPFHLPPKNLISDQTLSGSAKDIENNPRKYYFASLEALDKEIGRLIASISPEVLANTTIIFMGDNGTPDQVIQSPYTAGSSKSSLYEGGVWAPMTIMGKGITRQGARESALINSTDVFTTIADIAGSVETKKYDSVSFKKLLVSSNNISDRKYLYTEQVPAQGLRRANGWALRDNRYKLIEYSNGVKEFYDLSVDPYEKNNLMKSTLSADLQKELNKLIEYEKNLRQGYLF